MTKRNFQNNSAIFRVCKISKQLVSLLNPLYYCGNFERGRGCVAEKEEGKHVKQIKMKKENKFVRYGACWPMLLLAFAWACSPGFYKTARQPELPDVVRYLASPGLEGRKAGSRGDSLAAVYIRDKMQELGLKLVYTNGLQPFTLISSALAGESNHLDYAGRTFELNRDYLPYSFSSGSRFSGEILFAGYGFDIKTDSLVWNDYEGLNVSEKWVLILKGDPDLDKQESPFVPYSDIRSKVLTAIDHGAAGIIFTGGPGYHTTDQLEPLYYDKNSSSYPAPVFQVTAATADKMLAASGVTVATLEEWVNRERKSSGFLLEGKVTGQADVRLSKATTYNVAALWPGNDPLLKNETVVVGAHFDHLGMGGPGSGSRALDTLAVHYGADDNASGVAALLEVASRVVARNDNRRTIVFAAFGAEEMGLIGSKQFTAEPPVDLSKTTAMVNFDMVGRLDTVTQALSIGGTQTSLQSEEILNRLNPGFKLAFSGEGIGPSDHAPFYLLNIPVFFFTTGAHSDYHTPGDGADKINEAGIRQVADYAWNVVEEIANRNEKLTFQEAGSKIQRSRGGRFKVTLGVMPDYAGLEKNGMRVDAVSPGKPAEKAGMQKGDIITAIDGKSVGNIYDYMNRLKTLTAGQTISVDVLRNGKAVVLIVQL